MRSVVFAAVLALVGIAIRAQGPPHFRYMDEFIAASAGPVLGAADFDGDGDLDLLTNGTGIYLNDGNARFTAHSTLSAIVTGSSGLSNITSRPVAIGDLNGDGLPDVATASGSYNNNLVLWMSQGNGVLAPAPPIYPGSSIETITVGDLDLDGDVDIVVGMASQGWHHINPAPLRILVNNGAGVFTTGPSPAMTMLPTQIALEDMDGDGDPDLVVAAGTTVVIAAAAAIYPASVWLNSGSGAFFTTPAIQLPAPASHSVIAIGDVNGDGRKDVVSDTGASYPDCPYGPPPVVILNLVAGFQAMASTLSAPDRRAIPILVDVDGDGLDDLVRLTGDGAGIHPLGSGALAPAVSVLPLVSGPDCVTNPATCSFFHNVAVGDLDGDGDRDVVAMTGQGNRILFGLTSALPVVTPGQLSSGLVSLYNHAQAGDFDGDGDADLILGFVFCANSPKAIVALNDGAGRLVPAQIALVGSAGGGSTVWFDADHDGDLDVFFADSPVSISGPVTYHVLLNTGGTLVLGQSITLNTLVPSVTKAADLDGDGDLDLVAAGGYYSAGAPAAVLLNSGSGSFTVSGSLPTAITSDLAIADVDGDLDLDIVEANSTGCALFKNNGSGAFTLWPGLPSVAASSVAVADLDLDTDQDLVLDGAVMINDGAGNFFSPGLVPGVGLNQAGGSAALFDVDLDGIPDLVDGTGKFFRNFGGTLAFTSPEILPGPIASPIVHADFDGDGDQDLVAVGPRILTNVKRQLWRPMALRPGRPAALEISGAPGTPWLLFASSGTGSLALAPLGTVRLDVGAAQLAFAGTIPASGVSTISGTVPPGPASIGMTLSWQAVMYEPAGARLTGLEVTAVTVF